MKCKNCSAKFSADCYQGAPGGSSAPGAILILAAILFLVAGVLWVLPVSDLFAYAAAGIGVFVLIQVPIAFFDCRSDGGYADHKGISCPECQAVNKIRFWSL